MDIKKTLLTCELFEGLSEDDVERIVPLCEKVHVNTGVSVIEKGDSETDLYLVPKGRVSLEMDLSNQAVSEQLDQAVDSEIFGEMSLLNNFRRSANAIAMEDSDLLKISRKDLLALLEGNTDIGYVIMTNLAKIMARKLHSTNTQLREALNN